MALDVISKSSLLPSTLNPNAPLFVPLAYRTVEDFSEEWWALVKSSPWFRDYWLQECFFDFETDPFVSDIYENALPDDLDCLFFDDYADDDYSREKEEESREIVSVGALKWQKGRGLTQVPRYMDKPSKIVNVKVSPRTIHQPR
ncbi:hypothetical protein K2173_004857 [Erythroxylum novogranatense]|uniref:Ataxin-2 C-terminal domain-containing protein n=1 Tax=Erythroxylum novogranatense TaxID=1862640 RepID=A0AAV8TCE4_9ROSI|nr:hypothetical protein K2173_004857 [Erythroxylum novogranatense]